MEPSTREELESQAERAVRRGDLAGALRLYHQLCNAFPADEALAEKKALIEESLQPMELASAKARPEPEPPPSADTPLARAEALAGRGQYAEAIALYRKALAEKPDSPLLSERLSELFQLVQAQAPRPSLQLPADPQSRLRELLVRVGARKRPFS